MTKSDSELLAEIDASVSLLEILGSSIVTLSVAAIWSAENAATVENLDEDIAALREDVGRLNSKGIISEAIGAKVVEPVVSAAEQIAAAKDGPARVLESTGDTLKRARDGWPEVDVRVYSARLGLSVADTELEERRSHERELPAILDAEIRKVEVEAGEKRRADPRDQESEQAAERAAAAVPRAATALGSAEFEVQKAEALRESTRSGVRNSEAALDRARRSASGDDEVEHYSRQLDEERQRAARAQEALSDAERELRNARESLETARWSAERAREEAQAARERNIIQFKQDALRLEQEAAELRAARAGKLEAARQQRQQAEDDLAEARSLLSKRRDEAVRARRNSPAGTVPHGHLRAIRDIAKDKTKFQEACDSVTSHCRSLAANAAGLAALTGTKPRKPRNPNKPRPTAPPAGDRAQPRKDAKPESADVTPDAHDPVVTPYAQDPDAAAFAESIRGLKRARRRGYLRVWLIALPAAVAAFFILDAMSVSWAPAVFAVPVVLHLSQWLLWRNRLGGSKSLAANCQRIRSKANGIMNLYDELRDSSVTSAFDEASNGAAGLERLA